ncbi:MAG: hypothetical protein ABUS54_11120 [Actinomycetota bacterium]
MRFLLIPLLALVFATPAWAGCANAGYSYGGVETTAPARGLSATLSTLRRLDVASGHVAAWVGVGGAAQGANGADEWLQIGISAFPGGRTEIYYEVTLPNRKTRYTTVRRLSAGGSHRVAVTETAPNVWQASLDGRAVSRAFTLPGSDGRWRPTVTTESYDGGYTACNAYRFRLGGIAVDGGTPALHPFSNGGHTLHRLAANDLIVWRS